ncbi:uncharacterized protein KD926_007789 [Aspergillus affinis]|uniref:uncharacterized protein n=1 Tax=Aspergillus affinis TaxID=1070780 RepID=UPI0022FEA00D|nr:uncharacterized protein KD926_007789 [Aspergillus affinis]KAI9040708.1 hypothetical protein KD926_007789 [Aspergillus affinis]
MNVNMNMMDSSPHPFNQPSASSTAPYATISSATAPTTATHPPSDPLLFSSTSARTTISNNTNTTLNPNPHHAPADPLHHLQQQQPHAAETGPSGLAPAVAAAAVAAESQASVPAPAPASGPTATAPFLRDFSLVAEAAKRAQMSVVMRDLESVTL